MEIAICGIVADNFIFFNELYKYLLSEGHSVDFVCPETSGAYLLFNNKINFTKLKRKKSQNNIDLSDALVFELNLLKTHKFVSDYRNTQHLAKTAHYAYNTYRDFFCDNKTQLVFIWGGFRIKSSIAALAANDLKIITIYFEKGLLPKTLQIDQAGVNFRSKIKNRFLENLIEGQEKNNQSEIDDIRQKFNIEWSFENPHNLLSDKAKIKYLIKHFSWSQLSAVIKQRIIIKFFKPMYKYKTVWKLNESFNDTATEQSQLYNYVFLPLQVSTDSQLLVNSNWIKDDYSLIETVSKVVQKIDPMIVIAIKEHPHEYIVPDYSAYIKYLPNTKIVNSKTVDLIRNALCTITINSTVGFTSTIFNKPTIILGETLYYNPNLMLRALNENELYEACIKAFTMRGLNKKGLHQYAKIALREFVECDFVHPDNVGIRNVVDKIYEIVNSVNKILI